ncbi:ATP-binding cassette domain-containing protein [Odoribacter lunatus]|uniref:ATP-binding cassette domain-containing protein n=1 Tax=Odoribacter lunatus TaxID=2941335 RepID=UPI002040BA63|nr:ATP-binding cassette domain-containing protein [Odoribacter lunatus]
MSIIVENISKFYGKQKALNNISFSLKKGEICGFLGPNGAGKSTMMKIITGYLTDFTGTAIIENFDIKKAPLEAKKRIGYLPEHNPLYPDMYIQEYLMYVARLYHTLYPENRTKEIMELTGLLPETGKKIGQLSKGYKQRVGLAQALIHNPDILILDEPMTGLDPNQLEEVRHLITYISKEKTVMLSTHVMQEVKAICDRIIIINKGNLVADYYKNQLNLNKQESLCIEIRFAPNCNTQWLADLENMIIQQTEMNTFRIETSSNYDPRILLFNLAAEHHCPIIELKIKEKNLEELFHSLTSS